MAMKEHMRYKADTTPPRSRTQNISLCFLISISAAVTPILRQKAAKQNQITGSYYKFRQKATSNMLTDTFSVCEEARLYYLDCKSFISGKTFCS